MNIAEFSGSIQSGPPNSTRRYRTARFVAIFGVRLAAIISGEEWLVESQYWRRRAMAAEKRAESLFEDVEKLLALLPTEEARR